MTTHLQPEPASGGFAYASVRSDIANQMRTAAHCIQQLHRAAAVDIGRELIAIKERIEHGNFVEWIEHECQMPIRTAQRAMKAAEMVERNDKLSYLLADGLLTLSSRAAKPIAEKIIGRIDACEKPSASEIKEQIAGAKWAVRRESHITKPIPAQRPGREQEQALNEQREWGGEAAVNKYYAAAAAKMMVERLGNRLGQFLEYADKTDPAAIIGLLRSSTERDAALTRIRVREAVGTPEDEPPLPFMNIPAQDGGQRRTARRSERSTARRSERSTAPFYKPNVPGFCRIGCSTDRRPTAPNWKAVHELLYPKISSAIFGMQSGSSRMSKNGKHTPFGSPGASSTPGSRRSSRSSTSTW
jgi:hypothetical protein